MIAGIDYSLSCPCLCLMSQPSIENSTFYFLTGTKKYTGSFNKGQFRGDLHQDYKTEQERYNNNAIHFFKKLGAVKKVYIEDYSFASTGRVFNLAENTGLLKHKLWESKYNTALIPPTVVKKFATGKGNAKKEQMYESFVSKTGVNLKKIFDMENQNLNSPVSDIVDAYFIALLGWENL